MQALCELTHCSADRARPLPGSAAKAAAQRIPPSMTLELFIGLHGLHAQPPIGGPVKQALWTPPCHLPSLGARAYSSQLVLHLQFD